MKPFLFVIILLMGLFIMAISSSVITLIDLLAIFIGFTFGYFMGKR